MRSSTPLGGGAQQDHCSLRAAVPPWSMYVGTEGRICASSNWSVVYFSNPHSPGWLYFYTTPPPPLEKPSTGVGMGASINSWLQWNLSAALFILHTLMRRWVRGLNNNDNTYVPFFQLFFHGAHTSLPIYPKHDLFLNKIQCCVAGRWAGGQVASLPCPISLHVLLCHCSLPPFQLPWQPWEGSIPSPGSSSLQTFDAFWPSFCCFCDLSGCHMSGTFSRMVAHYPGSSSPPPNCPLSPGCFPSLKSQ